MFSVEQRNTVYKNILKFAKSDLRIVAAGTLGSTATGQDRWSDLDLTFGISDDAKIPDILTSWTEHLESEYGATDLFDISSYSTVYRVFLFPGNLQVDLSFTPGKEFGPLGPRFRLLFGNVVEKEWEKPLPPEHYFGLCVHHLVRARISIDRGKLWQAEYWISAAREQVLNLACHQRNLQTTRGRGFDQLPLDVLEPFRNTLVAIIERDSLLSALKQTVSCLFMNSGEVTKKATRLEAQLKDLVPQ